MQLKEIKGKSKEELPPDYNNWAVFSYGLFGTDGVSLEAQLVDGQLSAQGKNIHWLAADTPRDFILSKHGLTIKTLDYQNHSKTAALNKIIFPNRYPNESNIESSEKQIIDDIVKESQNLKDVFLNYIKKNQIGTIHLRNIFSLPLSLPAALAWRIIIHDHPELRFILHHHDFISEGRQKDYQSPFKSINELVKINFPPVLNQANVRHVVLNTPAKKYLKSLGIEEKYISVIPDSFDFNKVKPSPEQIASMKRDLFSRLQIKYDDLVIGIMTRIVPRKNIELAIQIAAKMQTLQKRRVVLFFAQQKDLKNNPVNTQYFEKLKQFAAKSGVTIAFAGPYIDFYNGRQKNGDPIYSFYDTYSLLDGFLYTSRQEGFGNQLLEAVWAKLPIASMEYPVFQSDIKPFIDGHFVSLGTPDQLTENENGLWLAPEENVSTYAQNYLDLLNNSSRKTEYAEANFKAFSEKFSAASAAQCLSALFA